MTKLNVFAAFAVIFLSSVLLANGMYSNKIFAIEAQNENNHDQNGNLNEAEINADIEQENKCKNDTECENENEINNQLSITTITQAQQEQQPETPTCEECFTSILSEDQLTSFIAAFEQATGEQPPLTSIEDVCNFIDFYDVGETSQYLNQDLYDAAFAANDVTNSNPLSEEQYNTLIQCLQDAGLNVDFPEPI